MRSMDADALTGQQVYGAQAYVFNVTTITRKSYDKYCRYHEYGWAMIPSYNRDIHEFHNSDQTDNLHMITQCLLGHLIFLYLLQ
jgi:hypothetical protein